MSYTLSAGLPREVTDTHVTILTYPVNSLHAVSSGMKLQARVDHILPTATARTDYVTGLEKWPANGQFFDGAQMAASL